MTTQALGDLVLESKNVRLLGHNSINGQGRMGEGIAIQRSGSRKIGYFAHESGDVGLSILDVTNPKDPGLLTQIKAENDHVRFNTLSLSGDILVVGRQTQGFGQTPGGVAVYDVSKPETPRQISFFDTSGPRSRGCHFVWFVDGRYMHLSTGMPDFEPNNDKDDQIYLIVDMADPQQPKEVGRWWVPGMKKGEKPLPRVPNFDAGHRLHNANVLPSRPGRAYTCWLDSGIAILDISDVSHPRMLSQWNPSPPYHGFSHTMNPIFGRELAVVSEEAVRPKCEDWPKLTWLLDIRNEENPIPLGAAPMPDVAEFAKRGGRFGSHNLYEDHEQATCAQLKNTTVGTYFNGGARIFDLRNPLRMEEIGYFIPKGPPGSPFPHAQINDVFVDEEKLIYAVERMTGGVYILEYTGSVPLD